MDIWSFGIQGLGLSSEEFWSITPREFHALSKVYTAQRDERRMLSGLIASCVLNVNLPKGRKPIEPMDFFESAEMHVEQDLDKLYAGVEYTLRMAQASFSQ